jgi:predicted hotdog family 3-hydroxylacyl-ACP dehydratase
MIKNKLLITSSLVSLGLISGCQNYLDRSETLSPGSGNHLAANEALMVEDPWKRNAYDTTIEGNGKRTADVVTRYENEHVKQEGGDALEQAAATASGKN